MSRIPLPFHVDDISAMARSLRGQLSTCESTPSHLEILNMLAKSTGYRNFQHFRAQTEAQTQLAQPNQPTTPVDLTLVKRAARYFNADGHLMRWPGKYSHRQPCLWVFWSKLPARQDMTEKQVNEVLLAHHLFEDHALLRRELYDNNMVDRTPDGRRYRRIERQPTPEALALIRHLEERRAN